jgi:hypothetical protein
MVTPRRLDVYEAAYLAGGPRRVVDTAVVALVETGWVRARTAGDLHVVQDSPRHEVEAAVLAAVGSGGPHRIDIVRWVATRDRRLTALADRLKDEGLLSGNGLARLLSRGGRPLTPTAASTRCRTESCAPPCSTGPNCHRIPPAAAPGSASRPTTPTAAPSQPATSSWVAAAGRRCPARPGANPASASDGGCHDPRIVRA